MLVELLKLNSSAGLVGSEAWCWENLVSVELGSGGTRGGGEEEKFGECLVVMEDFVKECFVGVTEWCSLVMIVVDVL